MRNGKVVEQGASEQIFQSPTQLYTQSLLADVPGRAYLDEHVSTSLGELTV